MNCLTEDGHKSRRSTVHTECIIQASSENDNRQHRHECQTWNRRFLRENRWNKAFDGASAAESWNTTISFRINDEDMDRRATFVLEHIIQASDVSHTMQHQTWNRRLFCEMYDAFADGRAEKNPAESWYEGEIWFFDNYIIPLAKKLKTCGVFGVSCDELLDYATDNRAEWIAKGREVVADYLTAAQTTS